MLNTIKGQWIINSEGIFQTITRSNQISHLPEYSDLHNCTTSDFTDPMKNQSPCVPSDKLFLPATQAAIGRKSPSENNVLQSFSACSSEHCRKNSELKSATILRRNMRGNWCVQINTYTMNSINIPCISVTLNLTNSKTNTGHRVKAMYRFGIVINNFEENTSFPNTKKRQRLSYENAKKENQYISWLHKYYDQNYDNERNIVYAFGEPRIKTFRPGRCQSEASFLSINELRRILSVKTMMTTSELAKKFGIYYEITELPMYENNYNMCEFIKKQFLSLSRVRDVRNNFNSCNIINRKISNKQKNDVIWNTNYLNKNVVFRVKETNKKDDGDGDDADTTTTIRELCVSRYLLEMSSEVWSKILQYKYDNECNITRKVQFLDVNDFGYLAYTQMVIYISIKQIQELDDTVVAAELLLLADKYDISGLKEKCLIQIVEKFLRSDEQVCIFLVIADACNMNLFKDFLLDYIVSRCGAPNFNLTSFKYREILFNQVPLLYEIIDCFADQTSCYRV